jgi:hypothetical protein
MDLLIASRPTRTEDIASLDDPTSEANALSLLWDEAEREVAKERGQRASEQARRAATLPPAQPKPARASVRFAYD